jgi:anti-sigma B factor antagonist
MHWTEIVDRRSGNVVVLELRGYLTLADEELRLMRHVGTLLEEGHRRFAVNLRHVSYIDSTGIGEIVGAYTKATRVGGRLNLCEVSARVREVLEATTLDTVLAAFETEAEAVRQLAEA